MFFMEPDANKEPLVKKKCTIHKDCLDNAFSEESESSF